ncbi:MAG TPA: ribonuclease R, partial [Pseudomonas sp.]|nr:ribonuclease R [Pseudomonas sp.]
SGAGERGSADGRGTRKDGRGKKADASSSKEREPVSAEVRKSREMKKALLDNAKGEKPAKSKPKRSSSKPKTAGKSSAKPDGAAPRKRKAKS